MKNCAQEARGVIEAVGGRVTPGEGMPVVVGVMASPATQPKICTTGRYFVFCDVGIGESKTRTLAYNCGGFVVDASAYASFKKISENFSLSTKPPCS